MEQDDTAVGGWCHWFLDTARLAPRGRYHFLVDATEDQGECRPGMENTGSPRRGRKEPPHERPVAKNRVD
jgi:hypothetical protein